jgi:hypothetical protein
MILDMVGIEEEVVVIMIGDMMIVEVMIGVVVDINYYMYQAFYCISR